MCYRSFLGAVSSVMALPTVPGACLGLLQPLQVLESSGAFESPSSVPWPCAPQPSQLSALLISPGSGWLCEMSLGRSLGVHLSCHSAPGTCPCCLLSHLGSAPLAMGTGRHWEALVTGRGRLGPVLGVVMMIFVLLRSRNMCNHGSNNGLK